MTTWISSSEKKWGCSHSKNCDVLIDQNGSVFVTNTSEPEPKGKYRFVFFHSLVAGRYMNYNTPQSCLCKPEGDPYQYTMVIHMSDGTVITERITLDQIDPIKAMISRNTYMELPKQNRIINMANVLYIEFKLS